MGKEILVYVCVSACLVCTWACLHVRVCGSGADRGPRRLLRSELTVPRPDDMRDVIGERHAWPSLALLDIIIVSLPCDEQTLPMT